MTYHIGDPIDLIGMDVVSTGGCLVRFTDQPKRILLMGAAHGLVRKEAKPGDPIAASADKHLIGVLQTWITFRQMITADVALVWVDPSRVRPEPANGGPLKPPGALPAPSEKIEIIGGIGGPGREGIIADNDEDIPLPAEGPDWSIAQRVVYAHQMVTTDMVSEGGDSGAIVVDKDRAIAGMVVGGRPLVKVGAIWTSQTVITPIRQIFNHPDFGGRMLELVTAISGTELAPPLGG